MTKMSTSCIHSVAKIFQFPIAGHNSCLGKKTAQNPLLTITSLTVSIVNTMELISEKNEDSPILTLFHGTAFLFQVQNLHTYLFVTHSCLATKSLVI